MSKTPCNQSTQKGDSMKAKLQAITIPCLFTILLVTAFTQLALSQTEISNWNDLNDIRNNLAGDYILMNDIDGNTEGFADFILGWEPLSSTATPFTGTFDGNGFAIVGLFIDIDRGIVGLFGELNNATIKNLGVVDANIKSTGNGTAVLAGRAFGSTTITNVFTTGSVETSGGFLIAGLVGLLADESLVTDCWSSASVTAGALNNAGGLVGTARNSAGILRSFATGNVLSTGNNAGGLVGTILDNVSITDSYARGDVEGNENVGGLVGNTGTVATANVTNTYSTGAVTGNLEVGGLIGNNETLGTVTTSYWDTESSGQTAGAGIGGEGGITGLSTADMTGDTAKDNMFGFDFDETWALTESYPALSWEQTATSISDNDMQLPNMVTLNQNYPNPFNPTTSIKYGLPSDSEVRLDIYNITGQHMAMLLNGRQSAGFHVVTFDAAQYSSGLYLYRIQTNSGTVTRKMMLVK